jgi:ABC-type multidrug transport system permease subunit
MTMLAARFLPSMWVICVKDLRVWLRHPMQILGSLLVPVSYFFVVFLGSQAVGLNPVAVVNEDRGPVGAQLVRALIDADVFRVTVTDAKGAARLYDDLRVVAVIDIPGDLSQRVDAHESAPVHVTVNNLNLDLTNDVRRAVPDAIATYYQGLGSGSPVSVTLADTAVRQRDVTLYEYSALPVIILIITVNGIITAGMAATNEFEQRTIKELLLAPCGSLAIIAGKVLAGFLATFVLAMSVLLLGAAFDLARPGSPLLWMSAIAVVALCSLFSAGLGIAVGTWFQRKQPVSYAATIVAVELFALAGGLGVIFFEPEWLQRIAAFDPVTYAIHSLQMAVFYSSFEGLLRDAAVLAAVSAAAVAAGSLALRRQVVVVR